MLEEIKLKWELFLEKLELIDLLMIFPSHRSLKAEWEMQNILLDERKWKKHLKKKMQKQRMEKKENE